MRLQGLYGGQNVAEKRPATHGVQHLGRGRLHPGALARGQDDDHRGSGVGQGGSARSAATGKPNPTGGGGSPHPRGSHGLEPGSSPPRGGFEPPYSTPKKPVPALT